ncbi:uncharacterized protein C8Q71DRAFT_863690 [Rhodofomes roseus]|uniref:Uncharacterized protein n=1 Tax=Rhodofomes roseus TaxID=34475 RepID=A0ABQ8JYR8_9APHY|nr:uncharacterized protein C8Q71DRAFT_863690 [Rhodofomes roseus]KAH9828835.1 hypothetical protein C8Q71DRAFT_863690 [Rhodofomes roseus]
MPSDDDDSNSLAGDTPPGSLVSHAQSLPPPSPTQNRGEEESGVGSGSQPSSSGPAPGESSSEPSLTSSATTVTTSGHKRRAPDDSDSHGDLTQYVGAVARHLKLKKTDHDELAKVAVLSDRELLVYNTVLVMKTRDRLDMVQPVAAVWEIPRALHVAIEHYTYAVLCSTVLPTYVTDGYPVGAVTTILSANQGWGYTSDVRNNKLKREIVEKRVGGRLTDRRAAIKLLILFSIGPDRLIELNAIHFTKPKNPKTQATPPVKLNVLQLAAEISGLYKLDPVRLTLELCARVAYLRRRLDTFLQTKPNNTDQYWRIVDTKLAELRKQGALKASRMIQQALREDQDRFGTVDTNEYEEAISGDDNISDRAAEGRPLLSSAAFLTS